MKGHRDVSKPQSVQLTDYEKKRQQQLKNNIEFMAARGNGNLAAQIYDRSQSFLNACNDMELWEDRDIFSGEDSDEEYEVPEYDGDEDEINDIQARSKNKIQEDPSNEQPSKAKVYKESRKRKCDKTYKTSFVKTKDNIEKMEVEGENTKDPYAIVINKPEHSGRVRLFGKGVTMTDLKKKGTQPAYKIPEEILRTIQSDLQSDLLQQLYEANPNLVIPEHLATSVRRATTSHTNSSHVNEPTVDQNNEYNDAGTSRSRLSDQHEDGGNDDHDNQTLM